MPQQRSLFGTGAPCEGGCGSPVFPFPGLRGSALTLASAEPHAVLPPTSIPPSFPPSHPPRPPTNRKRSFPSERAFLPRGMHSTLLIVHRFPVKRSHSRQPVQYTPAAPLSPHPSPSPPHSPALFHPSTFPLSLTPPLALTTPRSLASSTPAPSPPGSPTPIPHPHICEAPKGPLR